MSHVTKTLVVVKEVMANASGAGKGHSLSNHLIFSCRERPLLEGKVKNDACRFILWYMSIGVAFCSQCHNKKVFSNYKLQSFILMHSSLFGKGKNLNEHYCHTSSTRRRSFV